MEKPNNLSKRIFFGITAEKGQGWEEKIAELEKLKIREAALFLEEIPSNERKKVYAAMDKSKIKKVPLIHIRNDMRREELAYLSKRYNNPCMTIHESSFRNLKKWNGFHKDLFLEMNYDGRLSGSVQLEKIGGFCVDLSHFKTAEEKWSKEFLYTIRRKDYPRYFACNHMNGYSYKNNCDVHTLINLKQLDYLKTLPEFLFGKIIAMEAYNSIVEQMEFKNYVIKLLRE